MGRLLNYILNELKRRNIYKIGTAYTMVSWLTLQVVNTVVQIVDAPDWIEKGVLFILIAGFPITLLIAWTFEITPEGMKKTIEVKEEYSITKKTGRIINFIIIISLLLIISGLVFERTFQNSDNDMPQTQNTENLYPSIAVLPFKDMSEKGDQAFMGEAIADELLNVLAQEEGILVTARTSSFVFADGKNTAKEIGEKLNVGHILEGSIRRSGNRIRVTAQLINTSNNNHLWSKTYTKEVKEIFALEDEIVGEIHISLLEKLLGERETKNTKTINPEAYDFYIQGLNLYRSSTFESLDAAAIAFNRALEKEPDFLSARINLAKTLYKIIDTGSRSDSELLDQAISLLNEVLILDPNSSEAYYVLALIAGNRRNNELRIKHIRVAYKLNPNDADIMVSYARRLGVELGEVKARDLFERAQHLDPLNSQIPNYYAFYLRNTLREYEEAETAYKKAANINPNNANYSANLSFLYSRYLGNISEAIEQLLITQKIDPNDPDIPNYLSINYLSLGKGNNALKNADLALDLMPDYADVLYSKVNTQIFNGNKIEALELIENTLNNPKVFFRRTTKVDFVFSGVYLYLLQGNIDAAHSIIINNLPEAIELIDSNQSVNDFRIIALLSKISDLLSQDEKVLKFNDQLQLITNELLAHDEGSIDGKDYITLAIISVAHNKDDEAIQYIQSSINSGWLEYWRNNILFSPFFISLQDHPEFIKIIERIETEMSTQRLNFN